MKRVRFWGIFFACFMLFASTAFGQLPKQTIKISNKSVKTAYCAYAYAVDEVMAASTGESVGYHTKGWVAVPSGHTEYIPYNSKYLPFVYFILENNIKTSEKDKKPSDHPVPAQLLRAIAGGKKPRVDQFEIVQGWDGSIKSISGADQSDLEHVTFYSLKEVTIAGPVALVATDSTDAPADVIKAPEDELNRLKMALAEAEATNRALMANQLKLEEMIKTLESQFNTLKSQLNASQKQLDPARFDGVYATRGFVRQGKDYALLFATNEYDHWDNLSTPVNDAKALREVLDQKYGFETDLQENKTIGEMRAVLEGYAAKIYQPDDQLLVYFTGHGLYERDLKDGFIAGKNSAAPIGEEDLAPGDSDSHLSYAELERLLDRLDCRRILLVLDVDYGGTFDHKITSDKGPLTKGLSLLPKKGQQALNLAETFKVKTRWYLSAGGKEVILATTDTGQHSPFITALLSILRGSGDVLADNVLTIPEIERHLPSLLNVEVYKAINAYKEKTGWTGEWKNQTPASGPFGSAKAADKAFVFISKPQR